MNIDAGPPRLRLLGCGLLIATSCLTAPVLAQSAPAVIPSPDMSRPAANPPQPLRAFERDPEVRIDGQLDEAVWQQVEPLGNFRVADPETLAEPRFPTRVRLFYTSAGLYVGLEMEQPTDTRVAELSSRDQRQRNRDGVTIMLDTSGEGRYGYYFGVNLGDSLDDGTLLPERQLNGDWDGPWHGASARTPSGWTAELFLPWSMFNMPARLRERRIGIYVERRVAHLGETWAWPALPASQARFISAFQPVTVQEVSPRQQYSVFPYVSETRDRTRARNESKAGVDLFWRPTSTFQLMGTLNPDFGNVEADDLDVNLSAFETFFPEKRLFFLEGQEVFVTSPRQGPTPVNTRRIGGSPRPPAIPEAATIDDAERNRRMDLLGAMKLAGEAGPLRYGVMLAFEDDLTLRATLDGEPLGLTQSGSDYGIVRVLYEDTTHGAYRGLGWISTAARHPQRRAYVHGVDLHYLSAGGRVRFDGQALVSDIDDRRTGKGAFFDLLYSRGRGETHRISMDYFDRHIDLNDLGFLRRNDQRRAEYDWRQVRTGGTLFRNSERSLRGLIEFNGDNERVATGIWLDWTLTTHDLMRMRPAISYFPARFDDRSSRGHGSFRIEGRWNASLSYGTDLSRPFSADLNVDYNQMDLGGDSYRVRAQLRARPAANISMDLTLPYTTRNGWLLHQRERDFTTFSAEEWAPTFAASYFVTARQQLRLSLQWIGIKAHQQRFYRVPDQPGDLIEVQRDDAAPSDSFSISRVNLQLRYRWEMAPLSDLFLVYTRGADRRATAGERFTELFSSAFDDPLTDQLVMKLRYRFGS